MLDKERAAFDAHAAEWNRLYPGKFVVVKGDSLAGAFNTFDEALAAGARSFGAQSFLVRQLGEEQKTIAIPALMLGLLRAHA